MGYSRLVSFVRSIVRLQSLSVSAHDERPHKLRSRLGSAGNSNYPQEPALAGLNRARNPPVHAPAGNPPAFHSLNDAFTDRRTMGSVPKRLVGVFKEAETWRKRKLQ